MEPDVEGKLDQAYPQVALNKGGLPAPRLRMESRRKYLEKRSVFVGKGSTNAS